MFFQILKRRDRLEIRLGGFLNGHAGRNGIAWIDIPSRRFAALGLSG